MRLKFVLLFFLIFIYSELLLSQKEKKVAVAVRAEHAPKIDGLLDDACWENAMPASGFLQIEPYNGHNPAFDSEVMIVYDDKAVYIGAMLYDNAPDSIMKQYSPRDEINVSDFFGVYIDPFNNGLSAYGFFVTPVNVQIDMKAFENGKEDEEWNAVWESQTKIVENGWVVEFKIPYSALRFPKVPVQLWGMNLIRKIERTREKSSWSHVDNAKQGFIRQQGQLSGIENIEPPVRLSFSPFASAYVEKKPENEHWTNFYRAGLDVKYGINESFTLDMMLIPDFGQVQSDNVILNLSPFEVLYDEKRQFFIEGGELFGRANIFYSRRIGARPSGYWNVESQLAENEVILKNPSETQLINATKISGRTNKGLGIGFLNAMSINAYAKIQDTVTGGTREILTQPFTNYNLISFDQALKNNSYFSLINTNVSRFGEHYYANVTGVDFNINNNHKTFAISGQGALSQKWDEGDGPGLGYTSYIKFAKTSGQFRFSLSNLVESDTYNPNDMGYLKNNNEISNNLSLSYNFYKPFWKLLRMNNSISFWQQSLYNPYKYTAFEIYLNSYSTFRSHLTFGFNMTLVPRNGHDYFEARVPGRLFIRPATQYAQGFISSDFRKKFALEIKLGGGPKNSYGGNKTFIEIEPRFRPNDKILLVLQSGLTKRNNDLGFVNKTADNSVIYFGKRTFSELENSINGRYIFTEKSSLLLNFRHYWSTVDYSEFYTLNADGTLSEEIAYAGNHNINFNFFTVNLSYRWIFAPGSELSLVWKNTISSQAKQIDYNYFHNLTNTLDNPQTNSFSIKVLYYLDYLYLKPKHH